MELRPVGQPQLTVDPNTNHITNTGFTYDASGNLTKDGNHNYTFNAEGEVTQVDSTASYAYDGHRWRIQKTVSGTATVYVYSGSKVIAEYPTGAAASAPNVEYIYSGSKLLATIAGTSVTYHRSDHLSNRLETNSSGAVLRTFGQLPFGDIWYETGTADKWKFTGYERDSTESGLDYAMHRFYSSGFGRFQSADLLPGTLGVPQSLNRYAYVINDPINRIDPLGLFGQCIFGGSYPDCVDPGGGAGGVGGTSSAPPPLRFRPGGQGGGGTQSNTSSPPPRKNDCQTFADMVGQIANNSNNVQQFMDKMASTFTGATDSSILAMNEGAYRQPPPATRGFKDSGFQHQFQDGSNQVRHFTGGLIAGYDLGYLPGLVLMDSREVPGKDDPDIALNSVSTKVGGDLAASNQPDYFRDRFGDIGFDYHDLADFIRKNVCDTKK